MQTNLCSFSGFAVGRMMYSTYKQQRILYFSSLGHKSTIIVSLLRNEGLTVSKSGVVRLLNKYIYRQTGSIRRRPGSGCPLPHNPIHVHKYSSLCFAL